MSRLFFVVLLCAATLGCEKAAESVSSPSNAEFEVERLFSHEGCVVYRFRDSGRARYYVRCASGDATTSSSHTETCGKNCTTTFTEEIQTVTTKPD